MQKKIYLKLKVALGNILWLNWMLLNEDFN